MHKIKVPIKENPYDVIVKPDLLGDIGDELLKLGINRNQKVLIISNKEIAKLWEL